MTRVHVEWGSTGGPSAARDAVVAVVVDVLSWTTCVSIAVDRGIAVHPYRWRDATAATYAERVGAVLAVGRGGPGVSLSPASIAAAQDVERLVLPSPNGSTVAGHLEAACGTVVAASLRNRAAVARWASERARVAGPAATTVVVPAGERWPDGSLRPAVEDLWGAGAVVAALVDLGAVDLTPEAAAAAAAFAGVATAADLHAGLRACTSGRELLDRGVEVDLAVAAALDHSGTVPLLRAGAFAAAPG